MGDVALAVAMVADAGDAAILSRAAMTVDIAGCFPYYPRHLRSALMKIIVKRVNGQGEGFSIFSINYLRFARLPPPPQPTRPIRSTDRGGRRSPRRRRCRSARAARVTLLR